MTDSVRESLYPNLVGLDSAESAPSATFPAETIPGTKAFGERLAQGELRVISCITESGFTEEEAWKIFGTWRKLKCIRRKGTEWMVTHGGFWEKDALVRALEASS